MDEGRVQRLIKKLGGPQYLYSENLREKPRDLREETIQELVNIGKPAVPYLIKGLTTGNSKLGDSSSFNIRMCSADALGRIKDPSAVPHLIKMMDCGHPAKVRKAMDAVKMMGERSIPVLIEVVRKGSPFETEHAIHLLGEMHDTTAIPVLTEILKIDYSIHKNSAKRALENILIPELIDKIKIMDEQDDASFLSSIKELTGDTIDAFKGKTDRKSIKKKREILNHFADLTAGIQQKMNLPNRLNEKESLGWSKTRKKGLGPKQPIRAHPKDNQIIPRG